MSLLTKDCKLTVVEQGKTTLGELESALAKTHAEHAEVLQRYHEVWYNAPHTWHYTQYLGVGLMKCPNDLWIYQDIMTRFKPTVVIETGTYQGGSALWLATLSDAMGFDCRVFTIDIEDFRRCAHPKITFIRGDSRDAGIAADLRALLTDDDRLLVVLDADHSEAHVRRELDLYAPMTKVGDWLVVEDTNIGWSDGRGHGDRGAAGGLADYLEAHPGEFRQDALSERYLLTMNPGGWMQRIAGCEHGR